MNPLIVVVGYNRSRPLLRLLRSIERANYPHENVHLFISLDGGASDDVIDIVEGFHFTKGKKTVVKKEKHMGLKNHIMSCGDLVSEQESVILLEDDLYVDKHYFYYAVEALEAFKEEPNVAGISLYSPKFNEFSGLPFEPMLNFSSGYFMKTPCSWGQAWTHDQWNAFKSWLPMVTEKSIKGIPNLPPTVKIWPRSSWKKYFSAYMAVNNLYFFYPYISYSTNCSDPGGTHIPDGIDIHQVPLAFFNRPLEKLFFPVFGGIRISYDSFMEPNSQEIFRTLGLSASELEIDTYGIKPRSLLKMKKYVLTSRKVKKTIKSFLLKFHPIEMIFMDEVTDGEGLKYNQTINLAKSEDIIFGRQPYYKMANYYSYMPFETKKFLGGYIPAVASKIFWKSLRRLK